MSRTKRRSYFTGSFETFSENEMIFARRFSNSKEEMNEYYLSLGENRHNKTIEEKIMWAYKKTTTDLASRDTTRNKMFKHDSKKRIRSHYRQLIVKAVRDDIDLDNIVYINDYEQKFLKWVYW